MKMTRKPLICRKCKFLKQYTLPFDGNVPECRPPLDVALPVLSCVNRRSCKENRQDCKYLRRIAKEYRYTVYNRNLEIEEWFKTLAEVMLVYARFISSDDLIVYDTLNKIPLTYEQIKDRISE